MKTIGFIASKGGVGKSTLAAHIAICASRAGLSVAAIDLDPQRSLVDWAALRTEAKLDDVAVIGARVQEVPTVLRQAKSQAADFVVIDSAGRNDTVAAQLASMVDLVLVPLRAGMYDLAACSKTAHMLKQAKALPKSWGLLNACPTSTSRDSETRRALEGIGLQVCPLRIAQRLELCDALAGGLSVYELNPGGKAAFEISGLYRWLSEF